MNLTDLLLLSLAGAFGAVTLVLLIRAFRALWKD